jgi:hypothetical protein
VADLTQFVTVGLALEKIKDAKLYRETHSSFEGIVWRGSISARSMATS